MTHNSGLKRQVRARMGITGEPYSVALRAIQRVDLETAQRELERLTSDINEYRKVGWGRTTVPHGFNVTVVKGDTAIVRMPVIWVPRRDTLRAMASDTPATHNVDELRILFERGFGTGEYHPLSKVIEWKAVIDDGPRPGDLFWTVTIRVAG